VKRLQALVRVQDAPAAGGAEAATPAEAAEMRQEIKYRFVGPFFFVAFFLFQTFCHASEHSPHQCGFAFLHRIQKFEPSANALLCVITNGASVQENQIGFFNVAGCGESFLGHNRGYDFGVSKIHLATVALEQQFFLRFMRIYGSRNFKKFALSRLVNLFFFHSVWLF
jgi:hypothetical protein